jgi:hypothetical protein
MEIWVDQVVGLVELVENSHQPAIAFALVSGIKDLRALVTTSMSAGSIAFVVTALGNSKGNK